jgi:hypothetical protein
LAIGEGNASVSTRHFGLGIVSIKINVWEDTTIGVPTADVGLGIAQHKLFAARTTLFNNQPGMRFGRRLNRIQIEVCGNVSTTCKFWPLPGRWSMRTVLSITVFVELLTEPGTSIWPERCATLVTVLRPV